MTKKYRLKKKYESPLGIVHVGVVYSNKEWQIRWFPNLKYEDFDIKNDWFEVVEPERIEVSNITQWNSRVVASKEEYKYLKIEVDKSVSEDRFPAIKAAIENVLNPEPKEKDTLSRDWEITAYSGNGIFNIGDSMFEYAERAYAENMGVCIHSVRRLSDNTVWTAGEMVSTNDGRGEHKIDGFKVIDGQMCVLMKSFPTEYEFLSRIQKLPPKTLPLFLSIDTDWFGIVNQLKATPDISDAVSWLIGQMNVILKSKQQNH